MFPHRDIWELICSTSSRVEQALPTCQLPPHMTCMTEIVWAEQSLNQISPIKWRFISYDACSFFAELTNCYSTLYVTVVYENVVQIILLIPMDFCNNLHTFRDYLASPVVSLTAEQVSCCLHEEHQPFLPTSNIHPKIYDTSGCHFLPVNIICLLKTC